jgi:hypothetical protein
MNPKSRYVGVEIALKVTQLLVVCNEFTTHL